MSATDPGPMRSELLVAALAGEPSADPDALDGSAFVELRPPLGLPFHLASRAGATGAPGAGEDPDRWLVIGPDRVGNLLEVVVLTSVENTKLAIHAMPMRTKFRRLLGR